MLFGMWTRVDPKNRVGLLGWLKICHGKQQLCGLVVVSSLISNFTVTVSVEHQSFNKMRI